VRVSGQTVRKNVIYGVYAFFFLYLGLILATMVVVATGGYDLITSITAALATLGNIGPGLALVGPSANYAHFPGYITWWLAFAMLAGRLELYTVLLLFTREFWRR
jgi:trk system potassium uptake protein TrkH